MERRRTFHKNLGVLGFIGKLTDIMFIISISSITTSVRSTRIYEKGNY